MGLEEGVGGLESEAYSAVIRSLQWALIWRSKFMKTKKN